MAGDDNGEAADGLDDRRERPTKSHGNVSLIQPVEEVEGVGTPRRTFSEPAEMPKGLSMALCDELKKTVKAMCVRIRHTQLLRFSEAIPSKDGRHIHLDVHRQTTSIDDRTKKPYINNAIRSSRHTLWNFLPRQLVAQFSKLGNFYFLCVSILQMIPSVSTTGRYTTLVPLLIFVGISMSREGFDDLRRYRLDDEENNRIASILTFKAPPEVPSREEAGSKDTEPWTECKWQHIKVGDVLRIQRDQAIPADIVVLSVDGTSGVAYIETMALDGETNLKSKQASPPLARKCGQSDGIRSTKGHFVVEDPNLDFYKFEGRVNIADELVPLTNNAIVYRGSVLRNTLQVIGMVVYTGEECKIRMSSTRNPRPKAPALQTVVNRVVIMIICFVIALCVFNTVAYQIRKDEVTRRAFYLSGAGVGFFQLLASYFLMFNPIIPLSLYISLEVVKAAQIGLMTNDIDMYDAPSDTPMEPRTSTINEELGQVSYVFSDKTGTLTKNLMQFRKISVAGTVWFHDPDLREEAAVEGQENDMLQKTKASKQATLKECMATDHGQNRTGSIDKDSKPAVTGNDSNQINLRSRRNDDQCGNTIDMLEYVQSKPHTTLARQVRFFLLSVALCHTCLPEKKIDGEIVFQAVSPDELALVKAAQDLGYLVVDRQSCSITIQSCPSGRSSETIHETYEILDVIEFSSDRKRMSIVIRMPDQRICIFCKGADSVLQHRLQYSELAAKKSTEIKKEASKRKNFVAQQAIRGAATASSNASPLRPSMVSLPNMTRSRRRPSSTGNDIIIHLLEATENGVQTSQTSTSTAYHLSTPSVELLPSRRSTVHGESGSTFHDERVNKPSEEEPVLNDGAVYESCFRHVNDFASEGLRTLLYAYKYVDEASYIEWKASYQEAVTSLIDRQSCIEEAADRIERDFELIGAVGIEDKLQKGVPETINKLRRANIKIWMLTGDKRETAINVGRSCSLVEDYSTIIVLDHELGAIDQSITTAMANLKAGTLAHSVIVIDGQTLSAIEAHRTEQDLFLDLATHVDSVICCRASPHQKATLLKSVRKKLPNAITLAVGDGANDIALIQEAHIGVGITGQEGLQAARASDYSIAQFRFLQKLLLVHGHWTYSRTCKYVLGMFWKEMLFYLTQALFQRWNGYTATSLYESWSLTMFQILFTCLPVISIGIYEKDLAPSTLLAVPELYTRGQRNGGFNFRIYLWWTFMVASEAVIILFTMLGLYGHAAVTEDNGLYATGALTYTACVIIISIKMQLLELHNKSTTAVVAVLFSVGAWFVWMLALSAAYTDNIVYDVKGGFLLRFGRDATWWLTLIVILFAVTLFELAVSCLRVMIWPTDVDVFQAYEKDPEMRSQFEQAAADAFPKTSQ